MMNQRTKYRHFVKTIIALKSSLSYYEWQIKLKNEMGDKYVGLSLSALKAKAATLAFSIPEIEKLAETFNPNPGSPKTTTWGL